MSGSRAARAGGGRGARRAGLGLLLVACFLGLALCAQAPALGGEFLSDDRPVVLENPYLDSLDPEQLAALLDPFGPAVAHTANYMPVPMLVHAAERQLFGKAPLGYDLVNVALHAAVALVLVALLLRAGLPVAAGVLGGALFLLHPANVETVAMAYQLKTLLATGLGLGALLAQPRRPALALVLFALALLSKITAAAFLPAAALLAWARSREEGGAPPRFGWLAAWGVLLVLVAVPELLAYERAGRSAPPLADDPLVLARSVVAIAARYLWMAATGRGLAPFHAPEPAESLLDPWWLAGLVALGGLGARALLALRARREEAAWWILAAASFAPVSQVFPFLYPMADRYLYGILPGLIGGGLLAGRALFARLPEGVRAAGAGALPAPALPLAALVLAVALAGAALDRSRERAEVYTSGRSLMRDAARAYPDGIQAHLLRAEAAARRGDPLALARELGAAEEAGYSAFHDVQRHPAFRPLLDHPDVKAVVDAMALDWIRKLERRAHPAAVDYLMASAAHWTRGEREAARRVLREGLERGGGDAAALRERLRQYGGGAETPGSGATP